MTSTYHGVTPGDAHGKTGYQALAAAGSTLTTGLVSWWDLDEESGTRADAVGSFDLTDNNTVGFKGGKIGNAAEFVSGQFESLTAATGYDFGVSDFSISFWVYMTNTNLDGLVGSGNTIGSATNDLCFSLFRNTGATGPLRLYVNDGGSLSATDMTGTSLPNNTWTHVVLTRSGSVYTGYTDTTAGNTVTVTPIQSGDLRFFLGAIGWGAGPDYYLDGHIDLVGVWSRALTTDEIDELYNLGASIKNAFTDNGEGFRQGLIASYDLDEESGTRYNDAMVMSSDLQTGLVSFYELDEASGNRADSVGGKTLTDNSTVTSAAGKIGNAASFVHGNSECLNVDAGVGSQVWNCSGGVWTASMWIYQNSATMNSGGYAFGSDDGTAGNYSLRVALYTTKIDCIINSAAGGQTLTLTAAAGEGVVDPGWNHLVLWMNGDGVLHAVCNGATEETATAIVGSPRASRRIGFGARAAADAAFQTCLVDEAGFWNRPLTADERAELYNFGLGKHQGNALALTDNNTVLYAAGKSGNAALLASANNESLTNATADKFSWSTTGMQQISFWFKLTDLSDNQTIACSSDVATVAGGWFFKKTTTSVLYLRIKDTANANVNVAWTSGISAGTWYFCSIWYDGSAAHFQINDIAKRDSAAFTRVTGPTALTFALGGVGSQYLNGALDEVMVWDRLPSDDERAALYNSGAGRFYDFQV